MDIAHQRWMSLQLDHSVATSSLTDLRLKLVTRGQPAHLRLGTPAATGLNQAGLSDHERALTWSIGVPRNQDRTLPHSEGCRAVVPLPNDFNLLSILRARWRSMHRLSRSFKRGGNGSKECCGTASIVATKTTPFSATLAWVF